MRGLTNELRSIKSILVRFRDGVETEFNDLNELIKSEGLPIDLGGTGATNLEGARSNLGIETSVGGFSNMAYFPPGTHTWTVPDEIRVTGRKFIVVLSGGGGGAHDRNSNKYGSTNGGPAGLCASILNTKETSVHIVVGDMGLANGRNGGNSSFGTILRADGGTTGQLDAGAASKGNASGGILNIAGGGSIGGNSSRRGHNGRLGGNARDGVPGYCVIVW